MKIKLLHTSKKKPTKPQLPSLKVTNSFKTIRGTFALLVSTTIRHLQSFIVRGSLIRLLTLNHKEGSHPVG